MQLLRSVKQRIKTSILPVGVYPRTIQSGPFRGLRMELDLRGQTQVYLGLFEREVHPWVTDLSRGIRTAIDIGSAHGEYLLYYLHRTSAKTVLGFEPDPECRPALERNLALNGVSRDPRLRIDHRFVSYKNRGDTVSLDSLVDQIQQPCLIKMDVDGEELNVLDGATRMLELPRVRWIVETHSPELESACIARFEAAGYETRIVPNAWWRAIIPEHRPGPQNRWLVAIRRYDGDSHVPGPARLV